MPCNCNKQKKQVEVKNNSNIKIFNGVTVNYKKYPFFGRLWIEYDDGNIGVCGASLIKKGTESIVISAAHCIDGLERTIVNVQVGFYQPNRITKKYIYDVTKIVIHPDYQPGTIVFSPINDIALLYIAGTPPSEVPVLQIPNKILGKKFIIPRTKTKTIGYGLTQTGELAFLLQCGCTPIVSRNNPENKWAPYDKNKKSIIFAGKNFSEPLITSGPGDSGSPLLYVYNGITYLVGLVSFGTESGKAEEGKPGGYTNVNYFRDWITINAGV